MQSSDLAATHHPPLEQDRIEVTKAFQPKDILEEIKADPLVWANRIWEIQQKFEAEHPELVPHLPQQAPSPPLAPSPPVQRTIRPAWLSELAPLPSPPPEEKKEPKKGKVLRTVPFDIQRMRMFKEATPAAKRVLRMLYRISHLTKGRDGYYHRYVNAGVNGLAVLTGVAPRSVKRALKYWRDKRVIWLLHRGRPQTKGKDKCSRYELPHGRKQWVVWNKYEKIKTDLL